MSEDETQVKFSSQLYVKTMKSAYNNLERVARSNNSVCSNKEMILQFMSLFVPSAVLKSVYKEFEDEEHMQKRYQEQYGGLERAAPPKKKSSGVRTNLIDKYVKTCKQTRPANVFE